ncbi:MAG: hypothetical protein H0Z33_04345 [Bacillaceae bacterium]|nr:hypothetical protein [Bacillaceae bacterium]
MYVYLWMTVNALIILVTTFYIWMLDPPDLKLVLLAQFLGQAAFLLFLVNVNMYFIFLVIRKSPIRSWKVRLAAVSRIMMKFHIPIGLTGTVLILFHAGLLLNVAGSYLGYVHPKLVTGYTALLMLAVTLFGGWLRHRRASGFRRKFHLSAALIFAAVVLIHLFSSIN